MSDSTYSMPRIPVNKSMLVGIVLVLSGLGAWLMTPEHPDAQTAPELESIIPAQFGEWKQVPDLFIPVGLTTDRTTEIDELYDRVLMRTYVNKQGEQVMLALAYATEQKQDIKIHRPEVCYVAQGYQLLKMSSNTFTPEHKKPIAAQRLLMQHQNRAEAVTYWIRIGDEYPVGGIAQRMKILRDGLKGKVVDGILVRASTVLGDETESAPAYVLQENFLETLLKSLPVDQQMLLAVK
jgi:EpsI family protein